MIKKYWKYFVLTGIILLCIIWFSIRERAITNQAKKIAELEYANFQLSTDRIYLENELKVLKSQFKEITILNDSLKMVLGKKQKELKDLIKAHEKEIAELTNIPSDTIFVRLGLLYPNYDGDLLRFPFSASQIKPMYHTAVLYSMVRDEYVLQGESLGTCLNLNLGYESGILNLTDQVKNLELGITKCDSQVGNYKKEVEILNKKIRNKGFWNKTLMVVAGISTGIALIK
jgi:hypothetical protein